MEINKVETVNDFINAVKTLSAGLQDGDSELKLWFRGESSVDINTPLVPGLYRTHGGPIDNDSFEIEIYNNSKVTEQRTKAEFGRFARMFLSSKNIANTGWNNYYFMQHYGMKTRLLDWTESGLIALFFAISDKIKTDARIWILSPFALNSQTTGIFSKDKRYQFSAIYFPEFSNKQPLIQNDKLNLDELTRKYLDLDFANLEPELSNSFYPLAIFPYLLDERMFNQQSCFTLFGNKVNGLLLHPEKNKFLREIIIDGNKKKNILAELRWLGISDRTVYPDLTGISKSIEEKNDISDLILKRIK